MRISASAGNTTVVAILFAFLAVPVGVLGALALLRHRADPRPLGTVCVAILVAANLVIFATGNMHAGRSHPLWVEVTSWIFAVAVYALITVVVVAIRRRRHRHRLA